MVFLVYQLPSWPFIHAQGELFVCKRCSVCHVLFKKLRRSICVGWCLEPSVFYMQILFCYVLDIKHGFTV